MSRRSALATLGLLALGACADQPVSPDSSFGAGRASLSTVADESDTYLVRFKGQGVPAEFDSQVAALGGEVIFAHEVGVAAVSGISPSGADQLALANDIAAVDADAYTTLEEPEAMDAPEALDATPDSPTNPAGAFFYPRQWNMRAIQANVAWAAGTRGSSTTRVGVLDTGIDYRHADLRGRVDLAMSRSFLSAAENARVQASFPGAHPIADLHYHGTHVAATIASNGIAAAGVTSQTTLVGLKVCAPGSPANGWRGTCPTSGTLAAILYAADKGIPIINLSLGGTFQRRHASARGGDGPSFLATINQVMNYAKTRGTTIVVSAGNSRIDMDHDGNGYKSYCSAPAVICVSATGPTASAGINGPWTNVDALASYSNYGRSSISVAAPGGNRSSVTAACSGFSLPIPICRTGTFVVGLSGTSMAAPHVAGVAALVAAGGVTSPAGIRATIQQSADDLGAPGTDPAYGKGRINAARATGAI